MNQKINDPDAVLQNRETKPPNKDWHYAARLHEQYDNVQQMFEQQADATPDAKALILGNTSLTYGELSARSDIIAYQLKNMGVRFEQPVGICINKSFEMISGVLGILKAGCAYVPIDPNNPQERIDFIVQDANLRIMLTNSDTSAIRSFSNAEVANLDAIDYQAAVTEVKNLPIVDARCLMNIIYTSGSTGRPKGVMIEHRGMIDKTQAFIDFFGLTENDRHLESISFSFDVWGEVVFATLCCGGSVVLIDDVKSLSPLSLLDTCLHYQITKVIVTGSFWNALVDELERSGQMVPDCIRHFSTGAEVPSFSKLPAWISHSSSKTQLYNVFGPTEATIMSSAYRVPRDIMKLTGYERVPIGKPLPTVKHYVLDENLNPVPPGVPGELFIGGSGVARGYLNQPELTKEKFIKDPFSDNNEARLYKTGDIANFLLDGNLDFLGRRDLQVKIRGNRVEIEEVEVALSRLPGIEEAAVKVYLGKHGDKRLLAYVATEGQLPTTEQLRTELRDFLPDYMVPSNYIKINEIPKTVTGKIDRKSLPEVNPDHISSDVKYVPPRNALEQFLADVFCEALNIDQIGIYDDFFMMGGDSIKGALFINRIQEKLNEYIYIVALFDSPTIARFAEYLLENYKLAVRKIFDSELLEISEIKEEARKTDTLSTQDIEEFKRTVKSLNDSTLWHRLKEWKNDRAIFILSPPRSGTTLMRVLLGGHPDLFAPPELYLMTYNTMKQRAEALSGKQEFWRDGLLHAVINLRSCQYEEARKILAEFENSDITVKEFYRYFQEWLGGKILVDKTPFYAIDSKILSRLEVDFDNALYIHLVRSPMGMINSFLEARTAQLFRHHSGLKVRKNQFNSFLSAKTDRQLAELIWYVSHANILEFLKRVPKDRQFRIQFEELVDNPRPLMEQLCKLIKLPFSLDMLEPYKDKQKRMTDSIHPQSRMLGDIKFHDHKKIDSKSAEWWRANVDANLLSDFTQKLARDLGYQEWESNVTKTTDTV